MSKQVDTPDARNGISIETLRSEFPMLAKSVNGKPLVYLDNAATTQKPWSVINRMIRFETDEYATVRRGSYKLGEAATDEYEKARDKVARFVGTDDSREIVFTSGATQSINLVAQSYGRKFLSEGDEIIISHLEHHANIIPWQVVCEDTGASLKVIPVDDNGDLLMDEYAKLLNGNTKIVAVTHVSNALGTINPVKKIAAMAHDAGAVVLIDGAQSAPHMRVNVKDIDCDFFVFSGHKMYGPSGVGVLYGKFDILKTMPPYVTGGEMIETVTFEKTTFVEPPLRFEAGTPPITQVIGLGAAVDFIRDCGFEKISLYENDLLEYGTSLLQGIDGLKIIGNAKEKSGIISFTLDTVHPHDLVTILGEEGIAVRGGHHCAQPAMRRFGVPATARASVSFYNTHEELDALAEGVRKAMEMFS